MKRKTLVDEKIHESFNLEAERFEGPSYGCGGLHSLQQARNLRKNLLQTKYFTGKNEFKSVKIYKEERYKRISFVE